MKQHHKTKRLLNYLLASAFVVNSSIASADEQSTAPMFGSWKCTSEQIMQGGDKPIKVVESYTSKMTSDGVGEGDSTVLFYLPSIAQGSTLPVEMVSHSRARYDVQGDTLKLTIMDFNLTHEGRIPSTARAAFLKENLQPNASASTRSQMGAKVDRMAENFVEKFAQNYQSQVGKQLSIPFRMTIPAPGKLQKIFGNGATAATHQCTLLAR